MTPNEKLTLDLYCALGVALDLITNSPLPEREKVWAFEDKRNPPTPPNPELVKELEEKLKKGQEEYDRLNQDRKSICAYIDFLKKMLTAAGYDEVLACDALKRALGDLEELKKAQKGGPQ
jgi:hypothetical protein